METRELEKILKDHTAGLREELIRERRTSGGNQLPRVSIITPSFNQGRFIERTIVSILNQDWPNLEYIIVDGCSTDETVNVIKKYEEHIAWWVSEPDKGQTDAILKGLSRATGEFVTWVCSDDVLFPGAVRTMVEALIKDSSAGIVYGATAFIDENDRVIKVLSYRDMTLHSLLYEKHSTIAQPSSLMRRSVYEASGGLDPSLSYTMDYDLWIKLLKISKAVNLGDVVLSGYRLHDVSKTVGSYRKMALEKIAVNRRHTGDWMNKVIYSHYWYIVEDWFRGIRRKWRKE
ncbi:MAG: glycosyltransferase [Deltaproteobacteria bacterium]|nr:MAG: glycosyltransferase [Deltaproteobacteria bacterium]